MRRSKELNDYLHGNPDLKAMCNAFEGWIQEHELTPYLVWLTPGQWSELNYDHIFDSAKLILIFEETELVDFFNYMRVDWVITGLSEVVKKFGYTGVLGHIWSMGFYKAEESLCASPQTTASPSS